MVYSKPLNTLVVLALLSFANGFTFLGDWTLKASTGKTISRFFNSRNNDSPYLGPDANVDLTPYVGCSSISLNGGQTWSLTADGSSLVSQWEHTVGFWVNFESTLSTKAFQFGRDDGAHYIVSSTNNGILKVSFFTSSGNNDPANDVSITVPLSNFYADKWCFVAFQFKDSSNTIELNAIVTGYATVSKNSGSSAYPFSLPNGSFLFGSLMKGKFHKAILTMSASILGTSFNYVSLYDGSNSWTIAIPCTPAGTCIDIACPQSFDSLTSNICLSSLQYCTACTDSGCSTCDPDSARDEAQYCLACKDNGVTNALKNYHCNFYLGCAIANNCAGCSVKSTQCDLCAAGYFLNEDSVTSTTSCVSCADSCTSCNPGPNCYTCAKTITQVGTTCREDSVGYQISLDGKYIVLDFAHPLLTGLSISSFTATSSVGAPITTSEWTLTGCVAGLKQCKIYAPNIQESDLPIELQLAFAQA